MVFFFTSGWRLSNGIIYLTFVHTIAGSLYGEISTALSSISLLILFIGVPVSLFFLLITFVFFLFSGKKPKLMIPTYILLGFTYVCALGTFVALTVVEILLNAADIVFNSLFISNPPRFYYEMARGKVESLCIEDIVKGGLLAGVNVLSLCTLIIPFVTLILSFVAGRGKKKEQIEQK